MRLSQEELAGKGRGRFNKEAT